VITFEQEQNAAKEFTYCGQNADSTQLTSELDMQNFLQQDSCHVQPQFRATHAMPVIISEDAMEEISERPHGLFR
jgi:hypothetical protein